MSIQKDHLKKVKHFFCKKWYPLDYQKNLKNKTKDELEKKGRELGIELDKRQSKEKLIKEIENYHKTG